jgi:predicted dehydrogenase
MGDSRRKIRVGVVGVGHFGRLHAQKFAQMPDVDLVAVADADDARARDTAESLGVESLGDYRDLVDRIDAISVTVSTAAHHEVAAFFLDAGVDVFVEKPIAATLPEADNLIGKARAHKAILQVGHIERFGGLFKAVRDAVRRPLFIEAIRIAPFASRGTDVSVVLDVMIHDIDLILGIAGAPLEIAEAVGGPVFSSNDDIASARLKFANGCVANLTASRISLKKERRMRFFQHDAYVAVDFDHKSLRIVRRREGLATADLPVDFQDLQLDESDALYEELESFCARVRDRGRPAVTGEDGRDALAAAIMISESLQAHHELLRKSGLIGADDLA